MLMGRARGLVLPGDHGRVGGMDAGVWRSVVVIVGRGENLLYLRTDRRRRIVTFLKVSSRPSLSVGLLQRKP